MTVTKEIPSEGDAAKSKELQAFLDSHQYCRKGVLRYEWIFGNGYISTGGEDSTVTMVKMLDLKKGEKVLDVGCGIGGGDKYLVDTYGVDVEGIDLSENVIQIAAERYANCKGLSFKVADAMTHPLADESLDAVYSRDTILHISAKAELFKRMHAALKPGGRMLISDYCCDSKDKWTDEFKEYVKNRGYHLLTIEEFSNVLQESGFEVKEAKDATGEFEDILRRELRRLEEGAAEFKKEFSEGDYTDLVDGWKAKIERCAQGCQKWGILLAVKK